MIAKQNYPLYLSLGVVLILGAFWLLDVPVNTARTVVYPEIEYLKDKNFNFVELSKFFSKLAQDKGGEYAYKALAYATAKSLILNVDTHLLGHVVGDELYKQQGLEGMKYCTDDLRNACSHSIVVGGLLAEGIEAITKMVGICHEAPGGRDAYRMCVHGLGHGVLAYTEYDMRQAVELCKPVAISQDYSNMEFVECVGGITMEMMAGINDKEAWEKQKVNYFKSDDPLTPCNMGFVPENATRICYLFLTPHLLEAAGASPWIHAQPIHIKKAAVFCQKIPPAELRNRQACFTGFGKEFAVLVNEQNVQSIENMSNEKLLKIYEWCSLLPQEGLNYCLESALQSLFWGGENDRNVAVRFCALMPNRANQAFCFENLIEAVDYYIFDKAYRKEFCSEIPLNFQGQCKSTLKI